MLSTLILAAVALNGVESGSPVRTIATVSAEAATNGTSEPLLRDSRGRPMILASLNDRGPFPMIVDTAAQTSLISGTLAQELGLVPLEEAMDVSGATGSAQSVLYGIDHFVSRLFDVRDVALVGLPNAGSTDARGIVGMGHFAGRKLVFDRLAARLTVARSAPPEPAFVAITGKLNPNGFVVIPITLNGVRVDAVVDTGASVTIANAAARKLLGFAADDPRMKNPGDAIKGSTTAMQRVRNTSLDSIGIGPATLRHATIYFVEGEASPREQTPQVVLGDDLLNLFSSFAVDFGRAELQIPKGPSR